MNEAWNGHVSITSTHIPSQNADARGDGNVVPICAKTLGDSSTLRKGSTDLGGPLTACPGKPGVHRGKHWTRRPGVNV